MQKLEIHRQLVCSTNHITREDGQKLDDEFGVRQSGLLHVYEKPGYGWWIYVKTHSLEAKKGKMRLLREDFKFSQAFVNLIRFARRHKCEWIMLDTDGKNIEGLPTFD